MSSAKQNVKRVLALSTGAVLSAGALTMVAPAANAASGDSISVVSLGPVRNSLSNNAVGGVLTLKTKGLSANEVEGYTDNNNTVHASILKLTSTALGTAGSEDNSNQTVEIIGTPTYVADGADNSAGTLDGFDTVTVRIGAVTPTDGANISFAIFADDDNSGSNNNTVQATEARATVSGTTTGAPTAVTVSPATQSAPVGVFSGDYTVTALDAGGRTTQLLTGEAFGVTDTPTGSTTITDTNLSAQDLATGTATFKARGNVSSGLRTLTVAGTGGIASSVSKTATLDVVQAASLTEDDVDIVTGADGWNGVGGGTFGTTVPVRVDQSSIKVVIDAGNNQANRTVSLSVSGGNSGVKFGGATSTTLSTVLNASGQGTLTITPDAGTITDAGTIAVTGSFDLDFAFDRAQLTTLKPASGTYISKFGGSVDVTVSALDQFGLPLAGVYLTNQVVSGPDAGAESAKKQADANGQATFTITDTKASATNAADGDVVFRAYQDAFATSPIKDSNNNTVIGSAVIKYTADGNGADFTVTINNVNTAGTAYDPSSIKIEPVDDAYADTQGVDYVVVDEVGGTTGAAMTVTADNGAVVLPNNSDNLAKGAASQTGVVGQGFEVVGTKSGVVTLTVVSGGVTKTAKFTVTAPDSVSDARNVAVAAPAKAQAGQIATYTATVTDAFGNPVANFPVTSLNVQVSGPGALQDSSALTDASGKLSLNVRLDDGASSPVTVTVTGLNTQTTTAQFGASANNYAATQTTGTAPGLTASVQTATATLSNIVNIAQLEQNVADAKAAQAKAKAADTAADKKVAADKKAVAKAKKAVKKAKTKKAKKAAKAKLAKAVKKLKADQAKAKKTQANLDKANADLAAAEAALAEAQA